MPRALIVGITGQDGSYLAELLLEKGYEVHGLVRRASASSKERIEHIASRLRLHHGDLLDGSSLHRIVREAAPDEIYNLGAQSHVRVSFDEPEHTTDVIALGTLRLLEASRALPNVRFYQAGSSEMFGDAPAPQSEKTPPSPRSPYAIAKVAAHFFAKAHRESRGAFVASGILFNHESPRRSDAFVTRKITRAAARIKLGKQEGLALGNLDARRDWGFAKDYVVAMWKMLQAPTPLDLVIATGESHTVRELLEVAFSHVGLDWRAHVTQDPALLRPNEAAHLEGDARLAKAKIGWEPTVRFAELVRAMVDADLAREASARTFGDAW